MIFSGAGGDGQQLQVLPGRTDAAQEEEALPLLRQEEESHHTAETDSRLDSAGPQHWPPPRVS